MRRLDGTGAFMVYSDAPRHYQHTLKIAIIDASDDGETLEYSALLSRIEAGIQVAPYYRWKLARPPFGINHPYWIEDLEFDLAHHVVRIACPGSGDRKAFCDLVSELFAQPLDKSLPLWRLWIVEGLEGNRVAVINTLHHAYTDGAGFSNLMNTFLNPEKQQVLTSEAFGVDSRKNPGRLRMFFDSLLNFPVLMYGSLRNLNRSAKKLKQIKASHEASGTALPPQPRSAPVSPFNTALTHGRTFYYEPFPLADFKAVASANNATVNELLLAVVTSAVRSYYQERNLPMEQPLVCSIPISQRSEEQLKEIMGNVVSSSYVSLPIHIEDAVERLSLVKQSSQVMKDYVKATEGISFLDSAAVMPPFVTQLMNWLGRKTGGKFGVLGNLVVSNVAGPAEYIPLPELQSKVVDWFSMGGLIYNLGLNVTAWRYVDTLNVCIMADKTVVPDGVKFMSYVSQAFEEYRSLAP